MADVPLQLEQRLNVKFLARLGKNGSQIHEDLRKVYGEEAMKKTTVHKWVKRFREGRTEVKDNKRSGRPATSRDVDNVNLVLSFAPEGRKVSVRSLASEVNLKKSTVHRILSENRRRTISQNDAQDGGRKINKTEKSAVNSGRKKTKEDSLNVLEKNKSETTTL